MTWIVSGRSRFRNGQREACDRSVVINTDECLAGDRNRSNRAPCRTRQGCEHARLCQRFPDGVRVAFNASSAGGQLEHSAEVKSSTTAKPVASVGGSLHARAGPPVIEMRAAEAIAKARAIVTRVFMVVQSCVFGCFMLVQRTDPGSRQGPLFGKGPPPCLCVVTATRSAVYCSAPPDFSKGIFFPMENERSGSSRSSRSWP